MQARSVQRVAIALGFAAWTLGLWSPPAQAASNPDLVLSSITAPPGTALPGDSFVLTAVVTNQGTADAPSSTTKFYLVPPSGSKKNLKGLQTIAALAPGASDGPSITLQVYTDTAPGTYTLQACADGGGDIAELIESNNCKNAGTMIVNEAPNLIVSSIGNPPSKIGQGQTFTVKNTVKNTGEVSALASTTKYFLVSTVDGSRQDLKGTQAVPALNSGQSFTHEDTLTVRDETVPGTYKLQGCADSGKIISETSDEDNCLTTNGITTIVAMPDLVAVSVSVANAPLTVAPGATLAITADVKNIGLATADASTLKYILINTATGAEKNLNGTSSVATLTAGTVSTIQKNVVVYSDTPSGTYVVQACIDSAKDVVESVESNNCANASGIITVKGVVTGNVDLVPTAVSNPPASALPGDSLTVSATVKNQGTTASPASTTGFYLVNTANGAKKNLKGVQPTAALEPGASDGPTVTVQVYSDTLPGTYLMQACSDSAKAVPETSETNNCLNSATTVVVQKTPNLVVSGLANPPSPLALGQDFKATVAVKNLGSVTALGSTTKFYLVLSDGTKKDLKGTQSAPSLLPGQQFVEQLTLTVRPETIPGTYRLQACADSTKAVAESSDDDNCLMTSGTVQITGPPDLVITAVTIRNAPVTVVKGGAITVTAGIKNQGEGAAVASTMKYILVNASAAKNLNGTTAVAALRSGASTSLAKVLTVFNDTPVGVYNVQVCADSAEVVAEAAEDNNCLTSTTTVTVTAP